MIMWVISVTMTLVFGLGIGGMVTAPAVGMTHQAPDTTTQDTYFWDDFHADAVSEYEAQFTALYEGYETRWSKNGRLMIRQGNSGPYKFVKKAA
ncbi:hypothetical protein SEA_IBANTIK_104 [Streptomyces phage Ibantik]|uniref:Uncharacterized protein n=1 Tax=Streptomyces phage Ibantik TaxID=2182397 RepID=A0A2U8UNR9_9CAUD|nr:hypothetical protein QEH36_gp061 [Streptomyces phage Ibantik]AWN05325.1 hypothetical protein SEA_IBANTIK_104 [Streptomyces phage Ibantik]